MSATDRFLYEDVSVEVGSGEATPTDLPICFSNVTHSTSRNFADVTASCDADEVIIASKRRSHTFSFDIPNEGSKNTGWARLQALDASGELGTFTLTETGTGDVIAFQAYVTLTLFTGGRYSEGAMSRAELRVSNGYTYTPGA